MQRKQFLVKLQDQSEGDNFIQYLENNGYSNVHNVSYDSLRIKVLVVDKNVFFSTNATCLAALSQSGIRPIGVDDFYAINSGAEEEFCSL